MSGHRADAEPGPTRRTPGAAWWRTIAALTCALLLPAQVQAQVCAVPGTGTSTVNGPVNTYYAGAAGTLAAGATQLALGAMDARGGSTAILAGDLILIIQMQDGTLNTANNANYGAGTGAGQGTVSPGSAGLYEFVRADGVSGSTVTFSPALTNSYFNSAATTSAGQRRYQVIRVPRYGNVTMNGVVAPTWNGATGGVVAADASGTLTLGSSSVEGQSNRAIFVAGRGFRGGAGETASTTSNDQQWRVDANANGIKGEGIAGTPTRMSNKANDFGASVGAASLTLVTGGSGYPLGNYARGAPGNAGGGGTEGSASNDNQRNAGGGGGGNYASGGLGGRPWNAPLNDTGGRGGAGYAGTLSFNRVIMGGGGGAGGTNNSTSDTATYENSGIGCSAGALCSSGAAGGGIVVLRARTFAGSGVIDVRGAHGYNVGNDAAGGGGGGGSVVLHAREGGSVTIDARGGDGGNAWAGNTGGTANRHGPGGGGSGGFIVYSPGSLAISSTLTGGRAGRSSNGSGDTYGATGNNGGLSGQMQPNVPGVVPGADCLPDLRLAKTNNVTTLNNGGTSDYVLTVSNSGGPSTGTITVVDVLPAGLTVADGAVPLTGAQAGNWACTAAANVLTCTSTTSIAQSGTSVFGFTAQVATVADGSTVTNRARVGGGGDDGKPVPTAANTATCTGNNTPAGCAVDVDSVNAPLLTVSKTDNTEVVVAGGTTTYQLTVANAGTAPSAGTLRVVDVLPAGMSYAGASPFASGGFNCTWTAGTLSVTCERSTAIAAGANAIIVLPVAIAASTPSALTNRAQVGGGGDPGKPTLPTVATAAACPAPTSPETRYSNPVTGCTADTDTVTEVNLALEKDDGQPFMPVGGQTTYQFRVRNTGTAASSGTILFRDVLPAPMNWPATLTKGGANAADWTCTRVSATVVACTSTVVIPAGGLSVFSLIANVGAVTAGSQYTNRARIGGGGDPDIPAALDDAAVNACTGSNVPAGCSIDLNTAQNAAQIRLAKSHPDPQAREPGATVAFNLVVSNSGGTDSGTSEIRVVDVLPAGISYSGAATFTSGGFGCTHASGVITCNRSTNLAAGGSATISFNATVSAGAGSGTLTNRAQVAGGGDPQLGASTTATATTAAECSGNGTPYLGCAIDPVPVVLNADLSIGKTNNANGVLPGDTTTYTITVANAGPAAANGASVRDPSTANLACTTASCTASGAAQCPAQTGAALVSALQSAAGATIPQLPAGSGVVITLTCTVATPP